MRYGIIGCGMMGREHIANIRLLGAEVAAICDPDPEQRALNAQAAPGAVIHDDPRALVARPDVDVILIASPNHTHLDALRAVFAGPPRPVLVEKPVVTTLEDCRRLAQMARGWTAPLWVAMEYRYMPPVAALLAEAPQVGRARMLSIREHRYPFLPKVGDWNRFTANTGGTLVEKCCHFFDLMRLILRAEPLRVAAVGGVDVNHLDERYEGRTPDILDNAYVIVEFEGGRRAMLELCMFAEGAWFQEEIALVGDRARVSAYIPGPSRFWPGGAERDAEIEISPRAPQGPVRRTIEVDAAVLAAGDHHGGTFFQHRRFLAAARGEGPVEVTLADGLRAVALGVAAEQAVREGRVVEIEPLGLP